MLDFTKTVGSIPIWLLILMSFFVVLLGIISFAFWIQRRRHHAKLYAARVSTPTSPLRMSPSPVQPYKERKESSLAGPSQVTTKQYGKPPTQENPLTIQ